MKVLIATTEVSQQLDFDHQHALDGELVVPVVLRCSDTDCEYCERSWFGLVSHAPTTCAIVVNRPDVTEAVLRRRVHDWLAARGEIDLVLRAVELGEFTIDGTPAVDPAAAVDELVADHAREVRAVCNAYRVGTVVSRFGDLVAPRHLADAA